MSGTSKQHRSARQLMIERDLIGRGIRDDRVLLAMQNVPREVFVPDEEQPAAYADRAIPIACGQTISQPFMVAVMTELLALAGGERILEIGTGSGYQTAVLAEMAQQVVTIERHEHLSQLANERLEELGYQNVQCLVGDGSQGHTDAAPFDRVLVTAAAPRVPPLLLEQLAAGGILVAPVGPISHQQLNRIRKTPTDYETTVLLSCRFVPLIESTTGD